MACKAVDASAHGIKFLADDFIPVGCLLDLWVDDKSRPGKFFLSGDVRWTHKAGKISTMVGVRLQDGLATDIEPGREFIRLREPLNQHSLFGLGLYSGVEFA